MQTSVATEITLSHVANTYWPILAVSFVVSFLATPLCRRFALRRQIVDRPDDFLKPHKQPIPYLGGVAIFLGWSAGLILALIMFGGELSPEPAQRAGPSMSRTMMLAILLGGAMVVGVGLFDDLRLLSPKAKLLSVTLVTALLISFGLGNDTIHFILRAVKVDRTAFSPWLVLVYSLPITLLVTIGSCNATNLIDGLDGLCSGVLGIIAAGFLVLAVHLHVGNVWDPWEPWDVQRVVLSLAMMGAALGFLPYNRNPATIFMGDAGSMLLGFNTAVVLLLFAKSHATCWMLGAIMVFALPLMDMTLAIARRWRNFKPLMIGDRSHFYDQLIDRGLPVKKVVAISYLLAAFFALVGCAPIFLRTRYVIPLYFLVVLIVLLVIMKFDMLRADQPRDGSPPQ